MRDDAVGRQGIPFGGCAIVWRRNVAVAVNQIHTVCNRVCAVTIAAPTMKLVFMSVYMPVDDNTNQSRMEFQTVLNEIKSIINFYDDHKFFLW